MMLVCFFAAMAMIPLFGFHLGGSQKIANPKGKSPDSDLICRVVCLNCKDSYSDETIKAIIRIIKTNIAAGTEYKADYNSDTELSKRINKILNSELELYYIKNKLCTIPFSICSNGNTVSDKQYPYLSPVASPWDCFSSDYSADNSCVGVSLDGVDYLCKNGMSAEHALRWYLPE